MFYIKQLVENLETLALVQMKNVYKEYNIACSVAEFEIEIIRYDLVAHTHIDQFFK